MKKVEAKFYPKAKKVKINADSTEFYPQYLKYVFEYLRIPQNATIIFNNETIKGGIEKWLTQEENATLSQHQKKK